jgi:allantoin racemase
MLQEGTMDQVHKRFSDEQVAFLLRAYSQGLITRVEVQEALGIGKSRFFSLWRDYHGNPEAFSISYQRTSPTRVSSEAEVEGTNAVIINCFGDPGLDASHEVVSIPVAGPCEASMHLAAMLGHKFSVVTVLEGLIPELEPHAQKYGVGWKLASDRSVDLPVLDLEKGREQFVGRMVEKAVAAVREDGAHVIVLRCTGLAGLAEQVKAGLSQAGYEVPVIDPAAAALKLAETLVYFGLTHSKVSYPKPPAKEMVGYEPL